AKMRSGLILVSISVRYFRPRSTSPSMSYVATNWLGEASLKPRSASSYSVTFALIRMAILAAAAGLEGTPTDSRRPTVRTVQETRGRVGASLEAEPRLRLVAGDSG